MLAVGVAVVPSGHHVAPAVAAGPSAAAPGPVTLAEYRRLRAGMTLRQAHGTMGTAGVLFTRGFGYLDRDYRGWQTSRGQVWVHVTYRLRAGVWRLESKSARVPTTGDGW